jgi:hypothetical protein
MKDVRLESLIRQISTMEKDEKVKMLWQWTRQGHINARQFKVLIEYCV